MSRLHHLRAAVACVALAALSPAVLSAATLTLGHTAAGVDDVRFRVNGTLVTEPAAYLEFAAIQIEGDSVLIEALDAGDDSVIASVTMPGVFDPAPYEPAVLLAQMHPDSTPELIALPRGGGGMWVTNPGSGAQGARGIQYVDLATRATDAAVESTRKEQRCVTSRPNGGQGVITGQGGSRFGSASYGVHFTGEGTTVCTFSVRAADLGAQQVDATPVAERTTRFLLVGDGDSAPYSLLALVGTQIIAQASGAPIVVGAMLESEDFWFDVTRPSQGLSLFDLPAGDVIYGTWYTFADDGTPRWYFLDGATESLPGRRDVRIYEMSRSGPPVTQVGSAKLYYLDCNTAELRFTLGDATDLRTLRVQRSVPVATCSVFE